MMKVGIKKIDFKISLENGKKIMMIGEYSEKENSFEINFYEVGKNVLDMEKEEALELRKLFMTLAETFFIPASGFDVPENYTIDGSDFK